MIDKKEILKELDQEFSRSRKELGFKPTFDELEAEFSIKDFVLSSGFVSEKFSRQLCARIVDHYRDWHGYLNNLLMPNPSFFAGQTEAKLFNSTEDRNAIWKLITLAMKFSSVHSIIGLEADKEREKKFIDESYSEWVGKFKPGLLYLLEKVNGGWNKE